MTQWRALSDPALAASVSDLEFAHAVLVLDCEPLDDAPILELRIRKGVRRNSVKLAVATERPSALDPSAAHSLRFAPARRRARAALAATLRGSDAAGAARPPAHDAEVAALAAALRDAGEEIVILYGERLLDGDGAAALLALADALGLAGRDGAGLIGDPGRRQRPRPARGGRAAERRPRPQPTRRAAAGLDAPAIAAALAAGELTAVYLLGVDPLRDLPDRGAWERALEHATTVIAHASFLTDGIREHATVVFPAEAAAEKEGTVTHPDGRLQRLRPAIARQGEVRAEWSVLAELATRAGRRPGVRTGAMASAAAVRRRPVLRRPDTGGARRPRRALAAAPRQAGAARAGERAGARRSRQLRRGADGRRAARSCGSAPTARSGRRPRSRPRRRLRSCTRTSGSSSPRRRRSGSACTRRRMLVVDETGAQIEARVALRDAVPAGTAFLERGLARGARIACAARRSRSPPIPEPVVVVLAGDDESGAVEEAFA